MENAVAIGNEDPDKLGLAVEYTTDATRTTNSADRRGWICPDQGLITIR